MPKYYYRPIKHYDGAVLKCEGIVTDANLSWYPATCIDEDGYLAGVIVVDGYRGDRILASDFSEYKKF